MEKQPWWSSVCWNTRVSQQGWPGLQDRLVSMICATLLCQLISTQETALAIHLSLPPPSMTLIIKKKVLGFKRLMADSLTITHPPLNARGTTRISSASLSTPWQSGNLAREPQSRSIFRAKITDDTLGRTRWFTCNVFRRTGGKDLKRPKTQMQTKPKQKKKTP